MFKNNRNLFIIALIAVVNALGYGIIIPIIYSYSQKFGLTDFQNGLLFSAFSVAQFISTPIIGRLSDKYGRKPLLTISLIGTCLSFILMAFAQRGWMLFLARILDGATAGNIPVASAVISDTTEPKDRARGFGLIGASFGFGFVFGPAISAFTLRFGEAVPFLIAAFVSLVAVIFTILFLPETNTHEKEIVKSKMFDLGKLFSSLTDEGVGKTLIVSLIYSFAFALYIYTFQPFAVKTLKMTAIEISMIFTAVGVVGLLAQGFAIPKLVKSYGEHKVLIMSLTAITLTFLVMFFARFILFFIIIAVIHAFFNSFVAPLIQVLLSKETDEASQGSIMGLNASYISIGTIFGPIVGGIIASYSIEAPFLMAALLIFVCQLLTQQILRSHHAKIHAF